MAWPHCARLAPAWHPLGTRFPPSWRPLGALCPSIPDMRSPDCNPARSGTGRGYRTQYAGVWRNPATVFRFVSRRPRERFMRKGLWPRGNGPGSTPSAPLIRC